MKKRMEFDDEYNNDDHVVNSSCDGCNGDEHVDRDHDVISLNVDVSDIGHDNHSEYGTVIRFI